MDTSSNSGVPRPKVWRRSWRPVGSLTHRVLSLLGGPEPWVWTSGMEVPSLSGMPESQPGQNRPQTETRDLGMRRCAAGDWPVRVCSSWGSGCPLQVLPSAPAGARPVPDEATGSPASPSQLPSGAVPPSPTVQADWATVLQILSLRLSWGVHLLLPGIREPGISGFRARTDSAPRTCQGLPALAITGPNSCISVHYASVSLGNPDYCGDHLQQHPRCQTPGWPRSQLRHRELHRASSGKI